MPLWDGLGGPIYSQAMSSVLVPFLLDAGQDGGLSAPLI